MAHMSGKVAHCKTERWLTVTGQAAQNRQDYSNFRKLTFICDFLLHKHLLFCCPLLYAPAKVERTADVIDSS
jgi:hypothetical protein